MNAIHEKVMKECGLSANVTWPFTLTVTNEQVLHLWQDFQRKQSSNDMISNTDLTTNQLSWALAKKNAAKSNDDRFLKSYYAIRKQIVDAVLTLAMFNASHDVNANLCELLTVIITGSTLPTSDYDVTIAGPHSGNIVVEFYRLFRQFFQAEPADMFDTNVYGGPSFFTIWDARYYKSMPRPNLWKQTFDALTTLAAKRQLALPLFSLTNDRLLTTLQSLPNDTKTIFCPRSATNNSKSQEMCVWNPDSLCNTSRCWTFLSFFRFFHERGQKEAFISKLRATIPGATHDVDNYVALSTAIEKDAAVMSTYGNNCKKITKSSIALCAATDYYIDLLTRATQFENQLLEAVATQSPYETQKNARDTLCYAISHANMYGNEMYVTMGAVMHVVVASQMRMATEIRIASSPASQLLSADDLFGSFLENAGYAIHLFKEAMHEEPDAAFCMRALFTASKYVARMLDALIRHLENNLQVSSQKALQDLKLAFAAAEQVRVNARSESQQRQLAPSVAEKLFWDILDQSGIISRRQDFKCTRQDFFQLFFDWLIAKVVLFYETKV